MTGAYRRYLALIFALTHTDCATKPDITADRQETIEEGFSGEETIIVNGTGVSPAGLRTPEQKNATAKLAAMIDARRRASDICRSARIAAHPQVEPFLLPPSQQNYELTGTLKISTKPIKARCLPEGENIVCRAVIEFRKSDLKKECESGASGMPRW